MLLRRREGNPNQSYLIFSFSCYLRPHCLISLFVSRLLHFLRSVPLAVPLLHHLLHFLRPVGLAAALLHLLLHLLRHVRLTAPLQHHLPHLLLIFRQAYRILCRNYKMSDFNSIRKVGGRYMELLYLNFQRMVVCTFVILYLIG